jgi:hypothetical protein
MAIGIITRCQFLCIRMHSRLLATGYHYTERFLLLLLILFLIVICRKKYSQLTKYRAYHTGLYHRQGTLQHNISTLNQPPSQINSKSKVIPVTEREGP